MLSVFPILRLSPTTTPKIQDPFVLWVALQAEVQYLFGIFSNNNTQKKILSANGFSGERMPIFGLCLSGNPKIGLLYRYSIGG